MTDSQGTQLPTLNILTIETPTLGDRSYVVHDGEVAFVIDPQRDIDRVLDVVGSAGVRVTDIFETHIHNDYLTGGLALAERTGAAYHVNAEDQVAYERTPIRAGDVVTVGEHLTVRAIATPGHTYTHLSYALEEDGRPVGVFTGGSLLYGATGNRSKSMAAFLERNGFDVVNVDGGMLGWEAAGRPLVTDGAGPAHVL
jgi:glyoxylase-like metal-dependent hydrolase (beta-lactamase superfamily II)